MPRSGTTPYNYSVPTGTQAVSGQVISSTAYNAFLSDLTNNMANAAWPITYGGTGTTDGSALVPGGSAATPGVRFQSETNSGIYRVGAGDIGISILGTKVVDITSTGITGTINGYLPLTGGTLTGNLTVSKTNPTIILSKGASGQSNQIAGQTAGTNRWNLLLGHSDSESGGNAGSSFVLNYDDDSGAVIDSALTITRVNGILSIKGLYTRNASGGSQGNDTINALTYYKNGNYGVTTLGSPTATTSGTSIDYTSIPAGVRRVVMTFSGVSTNGTSNMVIQIGAGSVLTSGYVGTCTNLGASAISTGSFTNGLNLQNLSSASVSLSGIVTLSLLNSATGLWTMNAQLGDPGTTGGYSAGASRTLSGTLDRVRLTTAGGTDTFDAGSINIMYE